MCCVTISQLLFYISTIYATIGMYYK
jgi:hypothetical protein